LKKIGNSFKLRLITLKQRRPESRLYQEGLQLGACWTKTDTSKDRSLRDYLEEKRLPCEEEFELINHLINLYNS
jgi:hypothetical protein